MFAGKKSAQIREILISESAWEEMTCLFAPSLACPSFLPSAIASAPRKGDFSLAADYQSSFKETTEFFQTIQNKLHFTCTGHTATELIHQRVDATQPHMGMSSYKGEEVRKSDVTTAKNYLSLDEVSELNRVVNMWLDFTEDQAKHRKQIFLRD